MPLSCMSCIPADRTFTVTWQGQLPRSQSLVMTFTIAGETTVELQLRVNPDGFVVASEQHEKTLCMTTKICSVFQSTGVGGFTLPAAAENSLADMLGQTVADSRDYTGVASELGFTTENLRLTLSPTRALLAACKHSRVNIIDFIEAAEHLELKDVVDLLKNVDVGSDKHL